MLFNSFGFIFLFLPLAVSGFHLLRRYAPVNLSLDWLIACSLLFYALGSRAQPLLLVGSLVFNYLIARIIAASGHHRPGDTARLRRRLALITGIAANVAFLCYFKYASQLPLGISFYTLMQVMYLVDCYENVIAPSTLREHALSVAFFPTVVMGPILRVKPLLAQLRAGCTLTLDAETLARAVTLFAMGLFKKAVIADSFARVADAGFAATSSLSLLEAWASSAAYTLQLYYDLSGYSDMAVAAALLLGVKIPGNFNSPYQSHSIVEFWQRWHISLSSFIGNYLYAPIVRSFKKLTFAKAMAATFVSMLIAGIWHGSTWNFVVFGALHGLGLVINQYRKKTKQKRLPTWLAWTLTLVYVNITFIFFRAPTLGSAVNMVYSLADWRAPLNVDAWEHSLRSSVKEAAIPILLGAALVFARKNSVQIVEEFRPTWQNLSWVAIAMVVAIVFLNSNLAREFVYFNF